MPIAKKYNERLADVLSAPIRQRLDYESLFRQMTVVEPMVKISYIKNKSAMKNKKPKKTKIIGKFKFIRMQ